MKLPLRALLASILALSFGCATSLSPPAPKLLVTSLPKVNQIQIRDRGETLIERVERISLDSIRLTSDWSVSSDSSGSRRVIKSGVMKPLGINNENQELFAPSEIYAGSTQANGIQGSSNPASKVFISRGRLCWNNTSNCAPHTIWERAQYTDDAPPIFQQQLMFNGRTGNYLKFIYVENDGPAERDQYVERVQLDVRESNVLDIRGARIKVLKATDRHINYQLIANFPSRN
jgi:hypothetical protein